jgi:phosphatidylglycerophosphate synthase
LRGLYLRLGIAKFEASSALIAVLLVVGLLTDVFDGIIARQLKISTAHLRQLDTKIDRLFWLSALFALAMLHPSFFIQHIIGIAILGALEFIAWAIGKLKFKSKYFFSLYPIQILGDKHIGYFFGCFNGW